MAHTNQQRKRIRQDEKRQTANAARKSRVRSAVKSFEGSLTSVGSNVAQGFRKVMSELAKAAQKGVLSKGAAARKTSRLAARVKKAAQA